MVDAKHTAGERERFERYFAGRSNKGKRFRESMFAKLEDGTYAEDSVQRHWWTWQNAVALATSTDTGVPHD